MNANNIEILTDPKDLRTPVAEETTEIVNGEDQNQVVNAQPAEEFVSNYLNNDSSNTGTNNADTNVENDADVPAANSDIDTEGNDFDTVLPL